MMKIIGLDIERYVGTRFYSVEYLNECISKPSLLERYMLYILEDNKKYILTFETRHFAGYGPLKIASFVKEEISSFPPMQFSFKDMNKLYYSFIEEETTEYSSEVIGFTRTKNREYYPDGSFYIRAEFFLSNGRGIETFKNVKRKVWIFKGDSTSGKTFLSDKLNLNKYETDVCKDLPDVFYEDIIVVGNKYEFSLDDIVERIKFKSKTDIVIVNFEYK